MWGWLLDLLRDPVWQGMGAWIALIALIYPVFKEIQSRRRSNASWPGRVWARLSNRAKAFVSTIKSFFRLIGIEGSVISSE